MIRIVIETEEKNLPAFRAVAKMVKAKVTTQKTDSSLMDDLKGSLQEVADIRDEKKKRITMKDVLNGKN